MQERGADHARAPSAPDSHAEQPHVRGHAYSQSSLRPFGAASVGDVSAVTMGRLGTGETCDGSHLILPLIFHQPPMDANHGACRSFLAHSLLFLASWLATGMLWRENSSAGPALLGLYMTSIFTFLGLCVLARWMPQLRISPALATCIHFSLSVSEALWRSTDMPFVSWDRCCLMAAAWQVAAMRLYPATRLSWAVSSVALVVALAIAEVILDRLTVTEVVTTVSLPLAMMLSSSLFCPLMPSRSWLSDFLLGASSAHPKVICPLDVLATDLGDQLVTAAEALVRADVHWPLRQRLWHLLKAVYLNLAESRDARATQQLDLEAQPSMVQDFVLGNLMPVSGPIRAESDPPALREVRLTPQSTSFEEDMMGLLKPLLYVEASPQPDLPRASIIMQLSISLGSWDLHVLQSGVGQPLALLAGAALQTLPLHLSQMKTHCFLQGLESRYHSANPYHNSIHAADVLNSMIYFMGLQHAPLINLQPIEKLAALIAAAAHDVGHDGRTNRFHMVAETPLSKLFNDQSCLENMHCAITFGLLRLSDCHFFQALPAADGALFRSIVVSMILETDLAKHFQSVTNFKKELICEGESSQRSEDVLKRKQLLLGFVLKACDVGGSTKPFQTSLLWALRINQECFEQGDAERELGLGISPFCDRSASNVAQSQLGFYDFIVVPLFTALNEFLQSRRVKVEILSEMARNRSFWASYDATEFDYKDPAGNASKLLLQFHISQRESRMNSALPGAPALAGFALGPRTSRSLHASQPMSSRRILRHLVSDL